MRRTGPKMLSALAILFCALLCVLPSTGQCTIFEFTFEGTISRSIRHVTPDFPYDVPEYYNGQSVTGRLYWHSDGIPGAVYAPPGIGAYHVGDPYSCYPVLWAGVHIGDTYFDVNRFSYIDIGIRNGDTADYLHFDQMATMHYYFDGFAWELNSPHMSLTGPSNIFSDYSYPSYLDLSLFTSGHLSLGYMAFYGYDHPFMGIEIDINRINAVPEPSTILILTVGLIGFATYGRRKLMN